MPRLLDGAAAGGFVPRTSEPSALVAPRALAALAAALPSRFRTNDWSLVYRCVRVCMHVLVFTCVCVCCVCLYVCVCVRAREHSRVLARVPEGERLKVCVCVCVCVCVLVRARSRMSHLASSTARVCERVPQTTALT
jgi:hypothetical protein